VLVDKERGEEMIEWNKKGTRQVGGLNGDVGSSRVFSLILRKVATFLGISI